MTLMGVFTLLGAFLVGLLGAALIVWFLVEFLG